ncbi:hypothetical protein BD779DRAFT_1476870 [Infundibulicybe gibba]|nr:hypothetical protein BD779DRAFT_1476870 [Infundibulicybe gibba]
MVPSISEKDIVVVSIFQPTVTFSRGEVLGVNGDLFVLVLHNVTTNDHAHSTSGRRASCGRPGDPAISACMALPSSGKSHPDGPGVVVPHHATRAPQLVYIQPWTSHAQVQKATDEPTPESSREIADCDSPRHSTYPRHDQNAAKLLFDESWEAEQSPLSHNVVKHNEELMQELFDRSLDINITYGCHIMPGSTNSSRKDPKLKHAWTVLESFGCTRMLRGGEIHSLKNVLTMTACFHIHLTH